MKRIWGWGWSWRALGWGIWMEKKRTSERAIELVCRGLLRIRERKIERTMSGRRGQFEWRESVCARDKSIPYPTSTLYRPTSLSTNPATHPEPINLMRTMKMNEIAEMCITVFFCFRNYRSFVTTRNRLMRFAR